MLPSQEHWSTYIVEDDFKFIAGNGLNAVRIPVGWWIASDPTPPAPYVGGSLQALDNAFTWARYVFFNIPSDITISLTTSQNVTIMGGPVYNTLKHGVAKPTMLWSQH